MDNEISKRKRAVIDKKPNGVAFKPSGWAGPVSSPNFNPPEPVTVVYGEWFVPNITHSSNPGMAETVGFWAGIDGIGNGQVLQAGTAAKITGTSVDYWAWTEWFPLKSIKVDNFPINPGNYITVLVCAAQPNHGFCSMLNKTTNQATSIGITPPGTVTSIGATAEWIVEGITDILPVFSTVVFSNCSAGTKNHSFNMDGATITEITGTGGVDLTAAAIVSPTSALVKWLNDS